MEVVLPVTTTLNLTLNLTKNAQKPREFKIPISDFGFHYNIFADKTHNHTPFKNPINIPYSSLRITSCLNQPVQHVNPWLQIAPDITYPPFIFFKGLIQNPRWYTRDYSKQLTHISRSMPISSKQTIAYLQKTCLVSFKTSFDHSSSFNLPPIYFNIFFPSNPTLSRGIGVGWNHLVCILIQL